MNVAFTVIVACDERSRQNDKRRLTTSCLGRVAR